MSSHLVLNIPKFDIIKTDCPLRQDWFIFSDDITKTKEFKAYQNAAKLQQNIVDLSGLSGSPVFIDDKLIGVFSKFDVKESIAYIIPIYVIIKNIIR
jgi:hypothetical protein